MRVLLIHNFYQQPGGEDAVFIRETSLLRENGVEVETLTFTNDSFEGSLFSTLGAATRTLYNRQSVQRVREAIDRFRPDIVHVHNLFYTASPAVIRAAKRRGVPVVMTLHNFRLVCVNGLLMREGKVPCETCLTQAIPLAGIRHACFRGSVLQSAQLSLTTTLAKLAGTWRSVDRFVVMTDFVRQKFLASSLGLAPEQMVVKPNFVPDTGYADPEQRQGFYLFIGRLSPEKGIDVLLDAARQAPFPLKILGDGPLAPMVIQAAAELPHVTYAGWLGRDDVLEQLKTCRALVVPSVWYEGLPTVMLEAFATGTPIICSDQQNLNQIVRDGQTGLLFKTGNGTDLSRVLRLFDEQPDVQQRQLALNSRQEYAEKYTKETAFQAINQLYTEVIGQKRSVPAA